MNSNKLFIIFLQYLNTADFAMREELALKAAILAEKFAPDLSWYSYQLLHQFHIICSDIFQM